MDREEFNKAIEAMRAKLTREEVEILDSMLSGVRWNRLALVVALVVVFAAGYAAGAG